MTIDESGNQTHENPAECPECGGTGRVTLLTSTRPCNKCGGTGLAGGTPAGVDYMGVYAGVAETAAPEQWVSQFTYDELGRLRTCTQRPTGDGSPAAT